MVNTPYCAVLEPLLRGPKINYLALYDFNTSFIAKILSFEAKIVVKRLLTNLKG